MFMTSMDELSPLNDKYKCLSMTSAASDRISNEESNTSMESAKGMVIDSIFLQTLKLNGVHTINQLLNHPTL